MQNVTPKTEYYRFVPAAHNTQGGVLFTPLMGEVEPGRIYPVTNPNVASSLRDHPEWESVDQWSYDAQVKADKQGETGNAR